MGESTTGNGHKDHRKPASEKADSRGCHPAGSDEVALGNETSRAWQTKAVEEVDYINEEGLFYWMEDAEGGDIPLEALGIRIPKGCRFCI